MFENCAVVFPGQGSQRVGMLSAYVSKYPGIIDTFTEAANVLGYDLWQLVKSGPEEKLNRTEYTQPALLAAEVAMWRLQRFKKPQFMAGHSLGEYSALVCAGAIGFQDAIDLVSKRGQIMQQAAIANGGMMAVIGLGEDAIAEICASAQAREILAPANFNSIGQTVLAGHLSAIERAIPVAKQKGAKVVKLLPVSVPAHCLLMKPAAEQFKVVLDKVTIRKPLIPVVNNVDVCVYDDPNAIRDSLIRQIYSPVRWLEIVQFFYSHGVKCLVECGPGKVLAGLNKRIIPDLTTTSFQQLLEVSYGT